MDVGPKVSLLDLSKQFHFEIDDTIKEKICFAETLLISCGHIENDVGRDSDSEWTCRSTTNSEPEETNAKKQPEVEVKHTIEIESDQKSQSDDESDFHVFFFPDCTKPLPPTNSKASIVLGPDGLPQINPVNPCIEFCVCHQDSKTKECKCFTKIPCSCGPTVTGVCTCAQLEGICVCDADTPQVKCTCGTSDICICDPNSKINPVCPCDTVKPCICDRTKSPYPICTCKHELNLNDESYGSLEGAEIEGAEIEDEGPKRIEVPCDCQKPTKCLCFKGKDCTCNLVCTCDIQPKPCVCESVDGKPVTCEDQESKSICSCPVPQICTCDADEEGFCKCFPNAKPTYCTCENPENCRCFAVCECTSPCICDIQLKEEDCTCVGTDFVECTCPPKSNIPDTKPDLSPLKLKKTRAGKHGYRWCHDVDPRHTYFDYAYDRRDKISYKEEKREKVKILGLHDDTAEEKTSATAIEIDAPPYEKKIIKQSIDCCSTLGGMSINVECLGESKDKFLVQVTSHFSKEGAKAGTKLVSILDCNLHTMEENRTEHITSKETTKERKSYMAICDTGYYNKITKICGERHVVKRFYHSFEDAHQFLLEGANVVLLRYFALTRYRGKIKTDTVLVDGVVCESIYVCHGVNQAVVNGKTMFVCKVERHIIEASGIVHQAMTVLSLRGYIICHEWAENNYIIHINPLLNVTPEKDIIEEHAPLRKRWREDVQLLSDYLDFKNSRTAEFARYTSDSNALTNSVRDYLQALLMLQPQDAIHFTRHYFGATLSSFDLPHNDYFDSSTKHVRYFFFED